MTISEITINSNAKVIECERCAINSRLVFKRDKDCTTEGLIFACENTVNSYEEYKKLISMYPFPEYIIHSGYISEDGNTVYVYLS